MKSELGKQQYTVTLSDCNHLAHVIVIWQMQSSGYRFSLYLRAISMQAQSPGAYIRAG